MIYKTIATAALLLLFSGQWSARPAGTLSKRSGERMLNGPLGPKGRFQSIAEKERSMKTSGNPIFEGWYADPEAVVFGKTCWIFPTFSAEYENQLHFDAFSSNDLVTWTKHPNVLTSDSIRWAQTGRHVARSTQVTKNSPLFISSTFCHLRMGRLLYVNYLNVKLLEPIILPSAKMLT